MKVKLFWKNANASMAQGGNNVRAFEDEINAWLSASPHIKVIDIRQSSSGESFGSWLVSVWYEEGAAEPPDGLFAATKNKPNGPRID